MDVFGSVPESSHRTRPPRDYRSQCIVSLYVLVACSGTVQVVIPENGGLYFLFTLLIATAVTMWAVLDSRIRNHPMLHIVQFLFLISWPIAAPVYLIWTRGRRGLWLAAIHGLGLFATLCVFFYTAYGLLYYTGFWSADV